MSVHLLSGVLAILTGSIIVIVTFIPLVAISYRKRGSLPVSRLVGWISLCVYAIALWTYTLIPIPASNNYQCVAPQLNIIESFADVTKYDLSSIRGILTNPAILQFVFNIALFVPLGFLLRVMYRRGIVFATLTGLVVSLIIELTQLTGIWGLYPCAYRLFDFSDLLMNTAGAAIGSLLAIAFTRKPRGNPSEPGERTGITATRRLLGMASDALFLIILGSILGVALRFAVVVLVGKESLETFSDLETFLVSWLPVLIEFLVILFTGSTVGERVVLLRPGKIRMPKLLTRLLRFIFGIGGYGILAAVSFPGSGLVLLAFVVISVILVFTTRNHRGLAYLCSAAEVEDRRIIEDASLDPKAIKLKEY